MKMESLFRICSKQYWNIESGFRKSKTFHNENQNIEMVQEFWKRFLGEKGNIVDRQGGDKRLKIVNIPI